MRAALLIAFHFALVRCQGSSTPQAHPTRVDSVIVTSVDARVRPGETTKFLAVVYGSPGISQAVTWSVIGSIPGGIGSIDPDGTYHAPSVTPGGVVTAHATSQADPDKAGQASVTLISSPVTLEISPTTARVLTDDFVQFTATVTGFVEPTVAWSAAYGSIDANGLYRAPSDGVTSLDTVTATLIATGDRASANVTIQRRPPVLDAVSGPAAPGELITLTGAHLFASRVSFPTASGASIVVLGGPTTYPDTQGQVRVPDGAVSGPLFVQTLGYPDAVIMTSNSVMFQRTPSIVLHPERDELTAGESTPLHIEWLGGNGPLPLSYEIDVGTVVSGVYQAPSSAADGTVAHVKACATGTTNCAQTTLAIHAMRVEPSPALAAAGGTLDLNAVSGGGSAPATFALGAGDGVLSADGHYIAPSTLEDSGLQWLTAQSGSATTIAQIGVYGLQSGLLNRVVDALDWNHLEVLGATDPSIPLPFGATVEAIAVSGSRLFALRRSLQQSRATRMGPYTWIDMYDLTDPVRPLRMGTFECPTRATHLYAADGRLYAWTRDDTLGDSFDAMPVATDSLSIFDVTTDVPQLLREMRGLVPSLPFNTSPPVLVGGRLIVFGSTRDHEWTFPVLAFDSTADVNASPQTITVTLPASAFPGLQNVASDGDRLYATYSEADGWKIGQWDIKTDPPVFLGVTTPNAIDISMDEFSIAGPILIHGWSMYDRMQDSPVQVGLLPARSWAVATQGARSVLTGGGLYVLDTSVVDQPRLAVRLGPDTISRPSAAWIPGGPLYSAQALAGIGVYDVSLYGGPLPRRFLQPSSTLTDAMNAAVIQGRFLYATGANTGVTAPDAFAAWDLSDPSTEPVWLNSDDKLAGLALASMGSDRLVRGIGNQVQVWSTADPKSPVLVSSVAADPAAQVYCTLYDGTLAWVGLSNGDFVAFDISAPAPVEVGRVQLGAAPFNAALIGTGRIAVALATSAGGGLGILDTSAPAAPAVVSVVDLGTQAFGVAVSGSTAFVASGAGLTAIDITDPAHPAVLSTTPSPPPDPYAEDVLGYDNREFAAPASAVTVSNGLVWVGTFLGSVHAFDVRNLKDPRQVASGPYLPGLAEFGVAGLIPDGNALFVFGDLSLGGVLELDVTQPRNLVTALTKDWSLARRP